MRSPLAMVFLFAAASSCVHVTTCTCAAGGSCCASEEEEHEIIEIEIEDGEESEPMLTGVVVDSEGHPLPRVPVRIYGGLATRWKTGETSTDARGQFTFDEVSGAMTKPDEDGPWHHYVGVSAGETVSNLNPAAYLPWTDVTIAPGESKHVTLVLDAREVERRIAAERAR